jgi:hypothetical protein
MPRNDQIPERRVVVGAQGLRPNVLRPEQIGLCVNQGLLLNDDGVVAEYITHSKASWARIYFCWQWIEHKEGQYNWSWYGYDKIIERLADCGVSILANVARAPLWCAPTPGEPLHEDRYKDYALFLRASVERYKGLVQAWEIENEPDGTNPSRWSYGIDSWGSHPEQYAHLLGVAHSTIKSVDPTAIIVAGGVAHEDIPGFRLAFMNFLLQAGGGDYVDVFNFHYYPYFAPYWETQVKLHRKPGKKDIAAKTACFKELLKRYGQGHKPIWITETGTEGNPDNPQSLTNQAEYVKQVYTLASAEGVEKIFWYALVTVGEPAGCGLLTEELEPKPAFETFRNLTAPPNARSRTRGKK